MSEAEVSIQSENKSKESSSSTLVNNIIGGNNKEETISSDVEIKEAPASGAVARSPEPATAAANTNDAALDSNSNKNEKPTPAKRTPSKRLSFVERAQRESEELVKNLGLSLDIEGGRRTRSSTRGTPSRANAVATPPPAKKSRASAGTPRRGKGRKLDTAADGDAVDSVPESETTPPKTNISNKEDSSIESAEDTGIDTAQSTDESKIEEVSTKQVKENDIDHTPEKKKDKSVNVSSIATTSKVGAEETSPGHKKKESKTIEGTVSKETVAVKTSPVKLTSDAAVVKQQNKNAASVPHVTADDPSPTEPMEVDGCKPSTIIEETEIEEKQEKMEQDNVADESIKKTTDEISVVATELPKTNSIPENENKAVTNDCTLSKNVQEENAIDRSSKDHVTVKSSEENNSSVKADIPVIESTIEEPVTPVGKPTLLPTLSPLSQPTGVVADNKNENSNMCEPKLSSPPPISTASETVSTPQYCN